MRRALVATMFWISWLGCALAEDPVYFADPMLKGVVQAELWVLDPTPTDMLGLTSLTAGYRHIKSLTGLEYARNLQVLIVNWNQINDVSPLAGLTKLEKLVLHANALNGVSALSGLVNLRYLDLRDTGTSDLSALSGLSNLEALMIPFNQICDISPLSGLLHLSTLDLRYNEVSDLSPLSFLGNLRDLHLCENQITDMSPLTALTSLQSLDLRGNPWSSEACDVHIPQIVANNPGAWIQHDCGPFAVSVSSGPGGSVVEPGEGVFIYEYDEWIRLEARADPYFLFAGWSGSFGGTQNPEILQVRQDHQIQVNFVSTLDIIHVDDDGPSDPGPGDSTVGDPAENGTIEHPFDQIQEAIDVAADGAAIFVHPGTYCESIDSLGKRIEITGENPDDPNEMAWPVIQGLSGRPVVSITNGRDADCLLRGLVLTGGRGRLAGAVWCSRSHLTLSNCLVVGNRASDPTSAAIYCADNSDLTLVNCTVTDNGVGTLGATVSSTDSHVAVVNSILWGNPWSQIVPVGTDDVSVSYSVVAGGWPGPGCINADPLFAGAGHWANPNSPGGVVGPDNPSGIWVSGDYHLRSRAGRWDPKAGNWAQDAAASPCIDAGDPGSPVGWEPSPNGGIVNMGVYGGTTEASKSGPDTPSP